MDFITIGFLAISAAVIWAMVSGYMKGSKEAALPKPLELYRNSYAAENFAVRYFDPFNNNEIGIDTSRNLVVVAPRVGNLASYKFNDIVAVEAIKDGQSLTVANRGSQLTGAAVGGLLLGPVGLLLGGLSGSRRNVEKVSRLSLRVVTNDIINPVTEIVFLNWPLNGGLRPDDQIVKEAAKNMDEWYARFQTIVSRQMIEQENADMPMRDVTPEKAPYRFRAID